MSKFHGLVFDVLLDGGRKVSRLERTVELNERASFAAGFELPGDKLDTITYVPQDDVAKMVSRMTTDLSLQRLYQNGYFAAEQYFSGLKHPPLHGIDLRIFLFGMFNGNQGPAGVSIVSSIGSDRHIVSNDKWSFPYPTLLKQCIPVKRFTYRDWKEASDLVKETAQKTFFVAHLDSKGNSSRNKVRLSLEGANQAYSLNGYTIYSSKDNGFLEIFDSDSIETSILDDPLLTDQQRLPVLAALLGSEGYTRSVLDISPQGILDCMSPTTLQRARYRISVSHLSNLQFEVCIKMGNATNGSPFGDATNYLVNLDEKKVKRV